MGSDINEIEFQVFPTNSIYSKSNCIWYLSLSIYYQYICYTLCTHIATLIFSSPLAQRPWRRPQKAEEWLIWMQDNDLKPNEVWSIVGPWTGETSPGTIHCGWMGWCCKNAGFFVWNKNPLTFVFFCKKWPPCFFVCILCSQAVFCCEVKWWCQKKHGISTVLAPKLGGQLQQRH